jgi:hypothetical protein
MGLLFIPQVIRGGMILTGKNCKTIRKTCPSATLSIIYATWTDTDLCGERPATNHLSYGTALITALLLK